MRPTEVVVREMDRHGCGMVLDLLREGVGQASEPTHAHPHGEVLALDVGRVDVLGVGVAAYLDLLRARALRRAVSLLRLGIGPVLLLEHGVVDSIGTEGSVNGFEVHGMSVRRELDALG